MPTVADDEVVTRRGTSPQNERRHHSPLSRNAQGNFQRSSQPTPGSPRLGKPFHSIESIVFAKRRLAQLDELARMRAGAEWLAARPQLGQSVFARGQGEPPMPQPQAELYVAFLEATLAMLETREGPGTEAPHTYRPAPPDLWRISDALLHITEMLQHHPQYLPLERCLPAIALDVPDRPLRFRAALASTLLASLELTREGKLTLTQQESFGLITLDARAVGDDCVQGPT